MCIVLNTKCGGEVRSLERVNLNNQQIFPEGCDPFLSLPVSMLLYDIGGGGYKSGCQF